MSLTSASTGSDRILRFRASERALHWAIAIPFLVCLVTAATLLLVYNPAPDRPLRALVSWTHRLSGVCLLVAPLLVLFRHRLDRSVFLENTREAWRWGVDDLKWLMFAGPSALSSRFILPEEGKFNAGEKLNFMMVTVALPVFAFTGLLIWLPGVAWMSWLAHIAVAVMVVPLTLGHLFMAIVNPASRKGLSGMFSGYVDREWAAHHYRRWYRERFPTPERTRARAEAPKRAEAGNPIVRCGACDQEHEFHSWAMLIRVVMDGATAQCPLCGQDIGVVSVLADPVELDRILSGIARTHPTADRGSADGIPDALALQAWSEWRLGTVPVPRDTGVDGIPATS